MAPGSSYTVKLELWPLRKASMTLTEPATPYMDVEVEAAGCHRSIVSNSLHSLGLSTERFISRFTDIYAVPVGEFLHGARVCVFVDGYVAKRRALRTYIHTL